MWALRQRGESVYPESVATNDLPPLSQPGQRLGRYELLQRIAVGGMAEVYRARAAGPSDFRKLVAIKRLLPQHALDPQLLRMFLDESRLMARFAHPNLPHVIDVSDGGGVDVPFFVMEHVAGVDLREVMRAADGPLPLEHLLGVSAAVAAGLHHAHELRADDGRPLEIVHRDVSPSNVLVSFDGGVKVADFGVAKWSQQKSFTYQGQLKGKFAHMSPEQCRGEPLDRRSDVFALGTMMYEMATGQPPFRADSELELLSRIATHDATWPTTGVGSQVAPELRAIIMRTLKRDRAERFATTREIQLALEAFGRERRLMVSAVELAAYVESLFPTKVAESRASPSVADDQPADDVARIGVERTATDVFALEKTLLSRGDASARITSEAPSEPPVDASATATAASTNAPAASERKTASTVSGATRPTARAPGRGLLIAGGLVASGLLAVAVYRLAQPTPNESGPGAAASAAATINPPAARVEPEQRPIAPQAAIPQTAPTATLATPPRAPSDASPRPTRAGRARRGERGERGGEKDGSRLALSPTGVADGPPQDAPEAPVVKVPVEAPAAAKPAPFSTPRPAPTKIWDPDSPVPP